MDVIEVIINGIFIGFGSAIGSYFGNKLTANLVEKYLKKWDKRFKNAPN